MDEDVSAGAGGAGLGGGQHLGLGQAAGGGVVVERGDNAAALAEDVREAPVGVEGHVARPAADRDGGRVGGRQRAVVKAIDGDVVGVAARNEQEVPGGVEQRHVRVLAGGFVVDQRAE